MAGAFRTYHDASRRESGYVRFELFEQIGRPAHFAVIETWRDQEAFDAHQKGAPAAQFRDALQSIRVSGYDQRPYKVLSIGPPPADRGAVIVVSHVDIGGGAQVDAPALLRRLADTSRAERGCLRFDVLQHGVRANHFTVIEQWASQDALDRHAAAAHTKQYRDELQPASGSPLDERVYKPVE
jgi:quinol monooxygenase YgiN